MVIPLLLLMGNTSVSDDGMGESRSEVIFFDVDVNAPGTVRLTLFKVLVDFRREITEGDDDGGGVINPR